MTLYIEQDSRLIADPATTPVAKVHLKPANLITQKLWRAVESLRDIDNLLDGIIAIEDEPKKLRRVKILATPLYSFYQSIRDVKNYYESEKEYEHHAGRKHIQEIWNKLSINVDTERLKTVRDKLSGHVDKNISVEQVSNIVQETSHLDIGVWLHACILILFELLDLQVYAWFTDDVRENRIKLMVSEQVLVTINQEDGHPGYIEDLTFTQASKHQIELICQKIVENTQWIFKEAIENTYGSTR